MDEGRVSPTSEGSTPLIEALPSYFPSLDGLRAFSVLFVIHSHIVGGRTQVDYFNGWLGVDVFFVLSGFLITGLLLREEKLTGSIDMAGFYIRRAFRILPLYWLVLGVYVLSLQRPSQLEKWTRMKFALPWFLTFNNDIPLTFMAQKVGTTFGLSWTLGVEEKFYFFWPILCFIVLKSRRPRMGAAWVVYFLCIGMAAFSEKMGRSYSGLIVGAILAIVFSSSQLPKLKSWVSRIPAALVLGLVAVGFALVRVDERFVFVFSWMVALMVASLLLKPSWLGNFLSHPVLVWLGKRSYAMYLIQGIAIDAVYQIGRPKNGLQDVGYALLCFSVSCLGSAVLHYLVEEPARKMGKSIAAHRKQRQGLEVQRSMAG